MSIELLWIIPIVAAALLVLIIVLTIQEKKNTTRVGSGKLDLKREVDEYNRGLNNNSLSDASESRLIKIENTIQLVSTTLSSQQQIIENYKGKDSTFAQEFNELKHKLRELQQEYDLIISENYTLRARLNKIEQKSSIDNTINDSEKDNTYQSDTDIIGQNKFLNLEIFNNSRVIDSSKPSDLDDTSEINISEIKK